MMKLIGIEWMKLRRLNTLKIILAVYAVVVPTIYLLLSKVSLGPWTFPDTIYQFPGNYHMIVFVAGWFNLLVGVIIIVFTTNELKYKTQRQNVIDGLSKRDVILSKFFVVFLLTAVVSLYAFLVGVVIGLMHGSPIGEMFSGIKYIGLYFVSTLGYFTFAYFFANLVRLPALAIVLYLASTVVESIIGAIAAREYYQFFPLRSFADLIPIPIMPAGAESDIIWGQGARTLLALAYISIFVFISYKVIKKRDI
ncbi:MAG: ABC transporter permease [Crocinitomicaceae bacterium]|nr:ABC transporter permease [Crocinitomicaceae bacterium]